MKEANHSPSTLTDRYPSLESILAARKAAGLTQTAAADLVHTTCRVWQQREHGDRKMHPAFWELFVWKGEVDGYFIQPLPDQEEEAIK